MVSLCKEYIKKADLIIKMGKNWYVYYSGIALTINSYSYTIITAHKIKPKIRNIEKSEYECLKEFLYQAIFVPENEELLPRSIINNPDIYIYIDDFGSKQGDLCVVAVQNASIVGAAWTRIIEGYGHIDNDTPELAISILPVWYRF